MPPRLEPLGDQGAMARFDDEAEALAWAEAVRALPDDDLLDVVQAYRAVAVFHDPARLTARALLARLAALSAAPATRGAGLLHLVPCCYERGPDLARAAAHLGLSPDALAGLHGSRDYVVYAIGFCPGFPYLGYLPDGLCGVPRLASPRLRVEPGSVGLTGRQTGVYTEPRPGGWSLVGRTPLTLVDVEAGYFPLRTGDRVRFVRIDEAEFSRLEGRRL